MSEADYILSIVPPRDAFSTASRIRDACQTRKAVVDRKARTSNSSASSILTFIDLNAISPKHARSIAELFPEDTDQQHHHYREEIPVRFVDGGIIGGPPKPSENGTWTKPSLVVSGPYDLTKAASPDPGPRLAEVVNLKHIGSTIGPASGLKMCFASTTKGLTAIAIQSYTTAQTLGVLPELQSHLKKFSPNTLGFVGKSLTAMPPKAYRWVEEMRQIAGTFHEDGGFDRTMFDGVAEVYRTVAEDTELGWEKIEDRKRGKTAEDVADCMVEGIKERKKAKKH